MSLKYLENLKILENLRILEHLKNFKIEYSNFELI